VALQFVNIKAWMLALALAAGWVANAAGQPAANPMQRLLIVCAVMAAFALASNLTYALVGNGLRRWLSAGHRLLWFNRAMALMLLVTAWWMWNT
jgi:threonine/homoserine/homoserine lactone efflux protein